jgi:hypothetical protein
MFAQHREPEGKERLRLAAFESALTDLFLGPDAGSALSLYALT